MRTLSSAALAVILATAGTAYGQTVEFRIVERQGQTSIPIPFGATATTDGVLNFAIQARVTGGTASQFLGNFSFDIVAAGEADSNGTLTKLLTSNVDGSYAANTAQSSNGTVGRGGLSAIYAYLAGIGQSFNGLINTSGGTFTNTLGNQEIGLIAGSPTGNSLLLLTDTGGSGNPDTYPGSGTAAPIDPTIASTYLGAGGNFVDVYRFKYTLTLASTRVITFNLVNPTAQIASSLLLANGVWGPANPLNVPVTTSGVIFGMPAPGSAFLLSLAGLTATWRRRTH